MTGRYKAYPEYKDSGIDWIGDIPIDWKWLPIKRNFKIVNGSTPRSSESEFWDGNITWITPADLSKVDVDISSSSKSITSEGLNSCGTSLVPKGSLILSTRAPIGTIAIASKEVCTNQGCKSLVHSNNVDSKFYYYVISVCSRQLNNLGRGTTFLELSTDELSKFIVPTPPFTEQQKIARFLDHEVAKIDKLIAKQKELIVLLKEKRQTVISHAVTKGLNPHVTMKDTGVQWLGDVPEHWELKKFKHLFKIRKRIAGKTGYDILSITQKGIKVKDITSGEGQLSMDYSKYQLVYKGDFAMNHMDLLTGFVDISNYKGVTSPDYRVFTLEHKTSVAEYYLRLLQMGYLDKLFYPLGQGAAHIGRWRLPAEAFNEFLAPCPPFEEQEEISKFIKDTHFKIDALLEKAEDAIFLMKERKSALISAAVTGKINVRNWSQS